MCFKKHLGYILSWTLFSKINKIEIKFNRGGELFKHLSEVKRFSEAKAKFYAA